VTRGDALSIFAAARDAGGDIGLKEGSRSYTFAELASLTQQRMDALAHEVRPGTPHPLLAENTPDTVVALYALLELRVPALLVHPRLTAAERAPLYAAAERAESVLHPDAAAIIHTSGTTGEPRGAILTRPALIASSAASAANLGWEVDDCWLLCMPLARVGALSILTRCLAARRCVALAAEFDAARLPQWVAEQGVTLASLVPTMLSRVFDAHPEWKAPPQLRAVLLGGAAAPRPLLQSAVSRGFGIVVTYGMTETCSQVCATPYEARFVPSEYGVGIPLPGVDLRIRDERIEVRGSMLMAGYWNETPFPANAWFDTGDLGEIDARGCLHLHARRTDLIVTGGENAYPAEIERTLEAFPGIAAAGVFGVADDAWGQTVAAALVAEREPPSDAALIEYIERQLAPHKRPRHVCYVQELPRAPTGKLDRGRLAECARELRPLSRSRGVEA
jgi:O-succinylbenzoic acid--CoA ligase